jgi:hypothetical protein
LAWAGQGFAAKKAAETAAKKSHDFAMREAKVLDITCGSTAWTINMKQPSTGIQGPSSGAAGLLCSFSYSVRVAHGFS